MPYATTGVVNMTSVPAGNLQRLQFNWRCDSAGNAAFRVPIRFDGQMHRFAAKHWDGAGGTYSVTLRDEYDNDVFEAACAALTQLASNTDTLSKAMTADRVRPLSVCGMHWLVVVSGADDWGVFDLYYQSDEVDLDRAGVH
jgi:hypothetical protein